MKHLTPEQLDALLSGTAPADVAELRRHLAVCATCARRLAERARFEEQLEAAAARVTTPRLAEARIGTPRGARARLALAVAAALVVLLGVGLAMRRPARDAEVASRPSSAPAPRPSSAPAPIPAMIVASDPRLPASAARLAADVPGLTARLPRLCEDVVLPADLCSDPSDPTCCAPEAPASALALP